MLAFERLGVYVHPYPFGSVVRCGTEEPSAAPMCALPFGLQTHHDLVRFIRARSAAVSWNVHPRELPGRHMPLLVWNVPEIADMETFALHAVTTSLNAACMTTFEEFNILVTFGKPEDGAPCAWVDIARVQHVADICVQYSKVWECGRCGGLCCMPICVCGATLPVPSARLRSAGFV
jgi:hypothetical protein